MEQEVQHDYYPPVARQILLVEDDAGVRDMLSEYLAQEGYEVVSARHGQEALDILATHRPRPALILLDLAMPVMDGQQFLALRAQDPQLAAIPVVMISAGTRARAASFPPQMHIMVKPIDFGTLHELLATYVDRR